MPRIDEIDRNFSLDTVITGGTFISIDDAPFTVYGLAGKDEVGYYRMPPEPAARVSDNVSMLNRHMAGGLVRFSTNAKTLAVKAEHPVNAHVMPHMTALGSCGFDLYEGTRFMCSYQPPIPVTDWVQEKQLLRIEGELRTGFREYTLYLPLYGAYRDISLKVEEGAELRPAAGFRNAKPIVFYGSSITQGGCAGKPSMAFTNLLSRYNDLYVYNLGFSGSARAEDEMIDYLCGLDMEAFVMDYDHNSSAAELAARHQGFYKKLRAAQPELPILMASAVPIFNHPEFHSDDRRRTVRATYEAAKAAGDERVAFANGWDFFADMPFDLCTPDGVHPNDIGMYYMYKGFENALREAFPELLA